LAGTRLWLAPWLFEAITAPAIANGKMTIGLS